MRQILNIYLSVLLACLFSSCLPNTTDQNRNTITVVTLRGPSAMSIINLLDNPDIDEEIFFDIILLDEPSQAKPYLFKNKADLAFLPGTMSVLLYNREVPYKLAGVPVWGTLYLYADSTIQSWKDLQNQEIYSMGRGITPDIVLRYLLDAHNLEPGKNVTLNYSFPTHEALANASAAGKAPIAVLSEPLGTFASNKNKTLKSVFNLSAEWRKIHQDTAVLFQTALVINTLFAEENPVLAKKVLDHIEAQVNSVNQNIGKAAKLATIYDLLPDSAMAVEAYHRSEIHYVKAFEIKDQLLSFLTVFHTFNPDIIGGQLPDDDFFYSYAESDTL